MNAGRRVGITSIPLSGGIRLTQRVVYTGVFRAGNGFVFSLRAHAAEAVFNAEGNPALPAKAEFPRHHPKYPGRQAYYIMLRVVYRLSLQNA